MLTRIEIENFQSHTNTVMDFCPGTNVIVGKSDSGKSAILRAIAWVVTNRPLGEGFRTIGSDRTRVALYTDDGHVVERIRSNSENAYLVDVEILLEAFGTDVPTTISDILRLDSFHYQNQFDSPFLLSATPGEAARILNQAASIDEIDAVISGLRSSLLQTNREHKQAESQLEQFIEQLEGYANLPVLEEMLRQTEELDAECRRRRARLEQLRRLTSRIDEAQQTLRMTEHIPRLLETCSGLQECADELHSRQALIQRRQQLIDRARSVLERLDSLSSSLALIPTVSAASKHLEKLETVRKQVDRLVQLVSRIERLERGIEESVSRQENLENEYRELAPEICPLCGNRMKVEVAIA